ncbi:hypothetical protein BDF20DRAFT_819805, partial [Mycotypha africana]|uniref:uncharacterized protein n=1 Tax=Mycotypha africana TaxID=64632 RepID=UPI002301C9AD
YYFAYFTDIDQAFNHLKSTWDNNSANTSPSLSISDLYDTNSQPITIPAYSSSAFLKDAAVLPAEPMQRKSSSSSIVANALAVPSVIKDFLSPNKTATAQQQVSDQEAYFSNTVFNGNDSSSEDEDEPNIGWLYGTRRSGLKFMYGLLRGSKSSGTLSSAIVDSDDNDDDDDDDDDDEEEEDADTRPLAMEHHHPIAASFPPQTADETEVLNDRTVMNFKKYFLLPETEHLIAGNIVRVISRYRSLLGSFLCLAIHILNSLSLFFDEDTTLLWKAIHISKLYILQFKRFCYKSQGELRKHNRH